LGKISGSCARKVYFLTKIRKILLIVLVQKGSIRIRDPDIWGNIFKNLEPSLSTPLSIVLGQNGLFRIRHSQILKIFYKEGLKRKKML